MSNCCFQMVDFLHLLGDSCLLWIAMPHIILWSVFPHGCFVPITRALVCIHCRMKHHGIFFHINSIHHPRGFPHSCGRHISTFPYLLQPQWSSFLLFSHSSWLRTAVQPAHGEALGAKLFLPQCSHHPSASPSMPKTSPEFFTVQIPSPGWRNTNRLLQPKGRPCLTSPQRSRNVCTAVPSMAIHTILSTPETPSPLRLYAPLIPQFCLSTFLIPLLFFVCSEPPTP